MRIGRKEAENHEEPKPDGAAAAASDAQDSAARREVEEKYGSAPKEFDWTKVKGGAKGEQPVARKKKTAERTDSGAESPLDKLKKWWKVDLSPQEWGMAAAAFVAVVGIIYFVFLRSDPGLRSALSVSEERRMEQEAQKQINDQINALEKEYGADHPEVKQQREMMRQMKPK